MGKSKGLISVGVLVGIGALLHWHFSKPDPAPAPVPVIIVPKSEPKKPEPPKPAPEPPKPEIRKDFSKTDYRVLLDRFNRWQCSKPRSECNPDSEIYYVFQELLRRPEVKWSQQSSSMQEVPQTDGKRRRRR